jgi:hypothetical protein
MPPERKAGTPKDAVWAGGVDGGSWILCNKQDGIEYSCSIYNDFTGELIATGVYLHRKVSFDNKTKSVVIESLQHEGELPSYCFFDGRFIHLKNGEALVPDGVIMWPFDDKHGEKIFYKNGVEIRDEIEY